MVTTSRAARYATKYGLLQIKWPEEAIGAPLELVDKVDATQRTGHEVEILPPAKLKKPLGERLVKLDPTKPT